MEDVTVKKCPNCGTQLPDCGYISEFCPKCILSIGLEKQSFSHSAFTEDDDISVEEIQPFIPDRYRLDRLLGKGGAGWVFSAYDTLLHRKVALKIIKFGIYAENKKLLLKEARAMAALKHPNICSIHEISEGEELPYLVMEWIDGIPLQKAWGSFPLDKRLKIFLKIADAVSVVHDAGLIHSDITPQNILVKSDGEPVLVDFGLALRQAHPESSRVKGGTPVFSAPEQNSDGAISASTDVYALGVLFYLMLTDCLPENVDSETGAILFPEKIRPGLPWPLQKICMTAIEKKTSDRYKNARLLADDIRRYLRGETVLAQPKRMALSLHEKTEQYLSNLVLWRKQELITPVQSEKLEQLFREIQHPDSAWVIDSGKLSFSQVTLYLGGWILMLAFSFGIISSWDNFSPTFRYFLPTMVTTIVIVFGITLKKHGFHRLALGYLFTASVCVPVCLGLFLYETKLLQPFSRRDFKGELLKDYLPDALNNWQLLTCSALSIVFPVIFRKIIPSSKFTPLAVLFSTVGFVAFWACVGCFDFTRNGFASMGIWMAFCGLAGLSLGIAMNNKEESMIKNSSDNGFFWHDSWSILLFSVLAITLGIDFAAWNRPDMYPPFIFQEVNTRSRATAFIINGFILFLLSWYLDRHRTVVRKRLSSLLRWLMPAHILGAIIELEKSLTFRESWLWLAALVVSAGGFCFSSIFRQWRPFLVSGLIAMAFAYFRITVRIKEYFGTENHFIYYFVLATIAAGLIILFSASKLPAGNKDKYK